MNRNALADPVGFFGELGGLHDARVERVVWAPERRRLELSVDDLNSNSAGLPEYVGVRPATIALVAVVRLSLEIDPTETYLNIYEIDLQRNPDGQWDVELTCWPGGRIVTTCGSIEVLQPHE